MPYSSVTSTLKTRKGQSKKRKAESNLNNFDLQAAAANQQIATQKNKNMIDFLRLMQEPKVYSKNEMKEKFSNVEKKLLGVDKYIPAEDDSDGVASELSS